MPAVPTEPIASIAITDDVPAAPTEPEFAEAAPEFAEAALEFLVSSICLVLRLPNSDS